MPQYNLTVSILIPTLKRPDILKKTLEAVNKLNIKTKEVLVVCRPKDDLETYTYLKNCSSKYEFNLKIVEIDIPGVIQALNEGIKNTSGDIVAILDDDAPPRIDWLDELLKCYEDPLVAAVGGRDLVHSEGRILDKPEVIVAGAKSFWGYYIPNHHLVIGEPREVDVLKGCNMSFRKSALGTLHLDDRLIGKGAQIGNESWFILGFKRAGWKVVLNPNAIVDHYPAIRHDIARNEWSKKRCYENATNNVALTVSYMDLSSKLKFILYYIFKGYRYCPGLYYLLHGLLKRPKLLPKIIIGGWSGFFKGFKLAKEFEKNPPGFAVNCNKEVSSKDKNSES